MAEGAIALQRDPSEKKIHSLRAAADTGEPPRDFFEPSKEAPPLSPATP